jgi:hypothetical protein
VPTEPYLPDEPMLSLAEAAKVLDVTEDEVRAAGASESLRWAVIDGEILYPEESVRSLAARLVRVEPADPLIRRGEAGRILGITGSAVSRLVEAGNLTREGNGAGQRSYRMSAVVALRDQRDAAALAAGGVRAARVRAAGRADGALTAQEIYRAQAAHRARSGSAAS